MKKTFSIFLGILLLITASTSALPQKAHAQFDIVNDPLNMVQNTITAISTGLSQVKGSVLDPIAWALAKAVLQSVVKSTVNSINKGPNGTPGFVTNLNTLLQAVGDTAANSFISQLSSNGSIKSPFQTAIASSVGNSYLQGSGTGGYFAQNAYTLNKVTTNDTAFLSGNFSQGGLSAWMSAWSNPSNNPFGASMLAAGGLGSQVSNAQTVQKTELNQGAGFTASRGSCPTTTTGGTTQKTTTATAGSLLTSLTSLAANSTCQSSSIQTPGSTIKAALDKSLGSGVDTLVSAHTIDEMINSVLSQLINQITGSGGLSGVSQPARATIVTPATATTATTTTTTTAATYFDLTDPSQTAINANISSNFTSTLTSQITQLQSFQSQWTTINNAALSAKNALSSSICYANAQATITSTVQPIIDQAAIELAQASAGVTALQNIQAELPSPTSTTAQTSALSQASHDYTCLTAPSSDPTCTITATLPSGTDYAYAASQSTDTSSTPTAPQSLYTQMTQLTQKAQICILVH